VRLIKTSGMEEKMSRNKTKLIEIVDCSSNKKDALDLMHASTNSNKSTDVKKSLSNLEATHALDTFNPLEDFYNQIKKQ